jgi:hypothetical protein
VAVGQAVAAAVLIGLAVQDATVAGLFPLLALKQQSGVAGSGDVLDQSFKACTTALDVAPETRTGLVDGDLGSEGSDCRQDGVLASGGLLDLRLDVAGVVGTRESGRWP